MGSFSAFMNQLRLHDPEKWEKGQVPSRAGGIVKQSLQGVLQGKDRDALDGLPIEVTKIATIASDEKIDLLRHSGCKDGDVFGW